jgi:glycosyltransferase involved in cell wall biosynthesis
MQADRQDDPSGTVGLPADAATVAVIITAFNQARFLDEAIKSVLAQTRQADEIIVVDDGSTDDPGTVVAQFRKIYLIRQDNRGPSAARNTGLQRCKTSHLVFLDADDRLLPTALEIGLRCFTGRSDCAFVYGGFRVISESGHPVGPDYYWPIEGDAYLALLRKNLLGPSATVLYRRENLVAVNGFDETLWRAEDYELYLRIAQRYPIASHPGIVAEYRRHAQNVTNNHVQHLKAMLRILARHEVRMPPNSIAHVALKEGRANRRRYYVGRMLDEAAVRWRANRDVGILVKDVTQGAWWSPHTTMRALFDGCYRRAGRVLRRILSVRND